MQLKISLTFRRQQAKEKENTSIEQIGKKHSISAISLLLVFFTGDMVKTLKKSRLSNSLKMLEH